MKGEFYLADKVEHNPMTGKDTVTPNTLHFKLEVGDIARPELKQVLYDNLASCEHVKGYFAAYQKFEVQNPDFKCPWPEVAVEKGVAQAKPEESNAEQA